MFKNKISHVYTILILLFNFFKCANFAEEGGPSREMDTKYFKLKILKKHDENRDNAIEKKRVTKNKHKAINIENIVNLESIQKHVIEEKNVLFILRALYNNEIFRLEHSELHTSQAIDFQYHHRSILNIIRGYRMASISISGWNVYVNWTYKHTKVRLSDSDITLSFYNSVEENFAEEESFVEKLVCNKSFVYEKYVFNYVKAFGDMFYEIMYDDEILNIKVCLSQETIINMYSLKFGLREQYVEVSIEKVNCKILNSVYPYKTIINNKIEIEAQRKIAGVIKI
ncbi:hypothetical protein EDEG_01182 [Edhazardia aedis USNM 41457]|uniref:Uncharacterized protein n=1 Tax=Edhazardia aedis (strain USNM 41457) TaxID=1003232 RepID=J8ZY88_EDHAE|nr:hypothetical protein EDEG_01182 [Edhazardia aedis USNM 41457]|eukprot:EJW04598.1 hypothetical protein EDEG_01182 [Edhazardia aedis USNM 41457]